MLSYPTFGRQGLGNQLFQYAFLRSTARRLGTTFYCPTWLGDEVLTLDDASERAPAPAGIRRSYIQPRRSCGFDELSLGIEDHTELRGYFQSPRFWTNPGEVRRWFTFRPERVAAVMARYGHIQFDDCAHLHIRFGDLDHHVRYYRPARQYYREALACVRTRTVLVFSDDVERARHALRHLNATLTFVEGNAPYEDLFLMSRCRAHVCSASTFSWWGAWLALPAGVSVVVPREGATRPGNPVTARDFWDPSWTQLRALRGFANSYRVRATLRTIKQSITR